MEETFWGTCFGRIYDGLLAPGEIAGMRGRRRALLAQARGSVLEIGAGTGLNVALYPAAVTDLLLTEPDEAMARRLRERAAGRATVVAARADALPVEDASVDTVVSTLVLCTVDDPAGTLAEIRRVLRPDGQLLLIEHVRGHTRLGAALQRLLRRPWRAFARGCRCDQDTVGLLRMRGFRTELQPARWRAMPPVVAPLVVGAAFVDPTSDGSS